MVCASLLVSQTAFAATKDYVNYWTFDEGTGKSVNDSIGGQNGVLTGSSTGFGWASGKVGTALAMDGMAGEAVVLPNAILKGSQGTISLWFDINALSDQNIIFSAKSTSDNNVYANLAVDRDGRPQFQFRDSTNGTDRKAQGAKILNKNEWYNLVLTANSLTYKIYVNGEQVTVNGDNIGRWFPDLTNQTLMYRIGASDAIPMNGVFNGYLDDMKIYNRELSLDEVTALYAEGNAGRPTVPAQIAPKITLTISDDYVPFGGSVALNWSTVNVDSCNASGAWNETVATSGSRVFIKLASDASYTLSCGNKYGTVQSSVKVIVGTSSPSATSSLVVTPISTGTSNSGTSGTMPPPGAGTISLMNNLQVGSKGDDVKSLQLYLVTGGYLASNLPTGYFGALTKAALIKFQKNHNLPQTGFCGPLTRAALAGK